MNKLHSKKLLMCVEKSGNFETITFNASTNIQTWTVPAGVKKIHVDCVASQGGNSGGKGGRVECDLSVTPKQVLYIVVGNVPSNGYSATYNASDIRLDNTGITDTQSLNSRLIVAGGGGGKASRGAAGGSGGNLTGANGGTGYGGNSAGKGGTQSAGGAGGSGTPVSVGHYHNGRAGSLGLGGAGNTCGYEGNSGSGGAGYYGGGSGAGDWNKNGGYVAGGGGGSSFTNETLCSNIAHTQGYQSGSGYITISNG